MRKIKFIEINYHCHRELSEPREVIGKHLPSNLFVQEMKKTADIILVKHMNYEGAYCKDDIMYQFFRRRNSFWQIPRSAHRFVADHKPDIVLVQGFIFPLQVIALRKKIGRHCVILLQHHGEVPFYRKKIFQRLADKYVNGYLFSSMDISADWIRSGIVSDPEKCFEIPPASNLFSKMEKETCKKKTGMCDGINFLWVGRLNANKDPLTILAGFEQYFRINDAAKLYMIYQENDLLEQVQSRIGQSQLLNSRVVLIGKVEYEGMETWYNAADYIVSGSHHEGAGYALMEAMACGCVPIVTNIPASETAVAKGRLGYIFEKANSDSLFNVLSSLNCNDLLQRSQHCIDHFHKEMSPSAIAGKMMAVFEKLQMK